MKYSVVIFDFDGTLVDSVPIMREAVNAVADEFSYRPISKEEEPYLRTLSLRTFIKCRLRIPLWKFWLLRRFERRTKEEFAKRSGGVVMFHGMGETLRELREQGLVTGVVSSASSEIIERVLRESNVIVDFVSADIPIMQKAATIRGMVAKRKLNNEQLIYVGDELRDVEACRKAGISMLGVSWGLNDKATLASCGIRVYDTPKALAEALLAE